MQTYVTFFDNPWLMYGTYALVAVLILGCVVLFLRRRIHRYFQHRIDTLQIQKEHEEFESKMRFFVNLVH